MTTLYALTISTSAPQVHTYNRTAEGYLSNLSWDDIQVPTVLHGDYIEEANEFIIIDAPFEQAEFDAYFGVITGARVLVHQDRFIQEDGSCIIVEYITTSRQREWDRHITVYYDGCKSPYRVTHIMVDGCPTAIF